jgi:predicted GIY-YIG superfamily endonuclease
MSGKTIQIYLPSGDPRGLRIAEVTTRIVRCFEIPRAELSHFFKRPESQQVGVYFLIGEDESGALSVYIGQTGSLADRLRQHHQNKDFWTRALAVLSLTNNWTQTHATYLEWLCLQFARKADRFQLQNGNEGSKPFTPEALEADCQEVFETVRFLTTTLGHPIFEELRGITTERVASSSDASVEGTAEPQIYQCSGKAGADAKGIYTAEGFVVLKGSNARKEPVESLASNVSYMKSRATLLQNQKLQATEDVLKFAEDVLFSSPSAASSMVMGRPSNGWIDWVTPEGKTLDAVERKV